MGNTFASVSVSNVYFVALLNRALHSLQQLRGIGASPWIRGVAETASLLRDWLKWTIRSSQGWFG